MYYVTATDKFMSGWGLAENKINKVVVVCNSIGEAEEVEEALHRRSEMKYINIRYSKPYYRGGYVISWYKYNKNARFKFGE